MVAHSSKYLNSLLKPDGFDGVTVELIRSEPKVTAVPAESASELSVLKEKLLVMAGYAETAVNRAVKALIRRDDDMARRTREEDDLIDALELEIDRIALRLLEKRPAGIDLRFIAMAMKISSNLERVGDEATTISRRVLELSQEPQLQQAAEVPKMATLALPMLKEALDAFVQGDPAKAREDEITVVVQVNGKVRDKLVVAPGTSQAVLEHDALLLEGVQKWIDGKRVRKVIVVPDRLVNVVIG